MDGHTFSIDGHGSIIVGMHEHTKESYQGIPTCFKFLKQHLMWNLCCPDNSSLCECVSALPTYNTPAGTAKQSSSEGSSAACHGQG